MRAGDVQGSSQGPTHTQTHLCRVPFTHAGGGWRGHVCRAGVHCTAAGQDRPGPAAAGADSSRAAAGRRQPHTAGCHKLRAGEETVWQLPLVCRCASTCSNSILPTALGPSHHVVCHLTAVVGGIKQPRGEQAEALSRVICCFCPTGALPRQQRPAAWCVCPHSVLDAAGHTRVLQAAGRRGHN